MNNSFKFLSILLVTTVILIGFSCEPRQHDNEPMETDEYLMDSTPLIYHMSFMQRYTTKLYFAGMAENWGLADIYSHEVEEITEAIIEGKHVDDEIDISNLMSTMLIPQIENIETAIDAGDKELFERNYQTMIQTCNQCHQASDYGLVKITVPETNHFNQDFSSPNN